MPNNFEKYNELRKKYKNFIYENFKITNNKEEIILQFFFKIEGLAEFSPQIIIPKKNYILDEKIQFSEGFVFYIGMIELISYWKSTCSPNVIIKCGKLNEEQINWFKKLYFYGLGELFFTNEIKNNITDFMNITCQSEKVWEVDNKCNNMKYDGYIFPIGGGKDSCVTIETLKQLNTNNYCLIVNPKPVTLNCAEVAGYSEDKIITINRKIDEELIKLNSQGFINGHTPFSSLLAFLTYYIAFLTGKKYIALSNENSSNESNVVGEKINHQYSKSFEFENDFRNFVKKYLNTPVEYFSFLRPLNELQIASIFAQLEQYHKIFKSCNQGSKLKNWQWCCNCPKCMFVYIILSPFLYKQKLINIFGEDLYERKDLLNTFIDLTGNGKTKPFECVGTFEEVCFAITKTISNLEQENKPLPYMLEYYKNNFKLSDLNNDLIKLYNTENNLNEEQNNILKSKIGG